MYFSNWKPKGERKVPQLCSGTNPPFAPCSREDPWSFTGSPRAGQPGLTQLQGFLSKWSSPCHPLLVKWSLMGQAMAVAQLIVIEAKTLI